MADPLADLPDDVRELIEPHVAENTETLEAISLSIAVRRNEAKAARVSSGIESLWKDCEESYIGIDDANRMEYQDAKWAKPMSMDGPVTTGRMPRQPDHRSTAFVRLTARYVDAGAAKLGEILLPVDDKAFSFSETPIPEVIKAKDDQSQVVHDGMGNMPLTRPLNPGETPPPAASPPPVGAGTPAPMAAVPPAASPMPAPMPAAPAPPVPAAPGVSAMAAPAPVAAPAGGAVLPAGAAGPPRVPLTVADLAEENIEMARAKAKLAETRIYNWMVDCQYPAEMRKVIFDAARIGVGVLKAPYPKPTQAIAMLQSQGGGVDIEIEEKVSPAAKWTDPWNIFPDPACGENIHLGDFIFERDYLSARQVRDLKKVPGYIGPQIDLVLEEGPERAYTEGEQGLSGSDKKKKNTRYEVWYYYGTLKREEMDCLTQAAKPGAQPLPPDKKEVYAIITLINTSVIRATINPLDSGAFPYHSVPWQRRAGHWAGIGVAEQIVMPQRTINAATRAMLNNAGKSAGSQIIVDQSSIKPADGSWTFVPDKIWFKASDAPGADVRQNFMAIEIPNMTDPLMKIINYALQLAEESTSIPLITQGQSGATTPDTFGAAQLQNNNANQLLRSIGYAFDDYITEPVVRQFYEWLLLDPEVPDEEKGEFVINAHGSPALVERAIQDQTVAQMGQMAANPIYGINPKLWAKEFLKSKKLDPVNFLYTEEEQAKIDATPPPDPPVVAAAKVNAQVATQALVAKQGTDQQTIASEERIAQAAQVLEGGRVQNEQHKTLTDATVQLHEMAVRRELAMLDYANRHQINLDQVKSELAKTAMTLDTQKQLNAADNAVDLHKHATRPPKMRINKPPAQLPGRAGNGRAFEQGPPK